MTRSGRSVEKLEYGVGEGEATLSIQRGEANVQVGKPEGSMAIHSDSVRDIEVTFREGDMDNSMSLNGGGDFGHGMGTINATGEEKLCLGTGDDGGAEGIIIALDERDSNIRASDFWHEAADGRGRSIFSVLVELLDRVTHETIEGGGVKGAGLLFSSDVDAALLLVSSQSSLINCPGSSVARRSEGVCGGCVRGLERCVLGVLLLALHGVAAVRGRGEAHEGTHVRSEARGGYGSCVIILRAEQRAWSASIE